MSSLLLKNDAQTAENWVNQTLGAYLSDNTENEGDHSEAVRILSWTATTLVQLETTAKELDEQLAKEASQLTTRLVPELHANLSDLQQRAQQVQANVLLAVQTVNTMEKDEES